MNYDINIVGHEIDNGKIEIERLSEIGKLTKEIAQKALMIRLAGTSSISFPVSLRKGMDLMIENVSGNIGDGTKIVFDCNSFNETITGYQRDIFKPSDDILTLTPMYLVIESFREAIVESKKDSENLDKSLLGSLSKFKKLFLSENELFKLSNRGTVAEIVLKKEDFIQIENLEKNIPTPKKITVSGQLDMMTLSKNKIKLKANDDDVVVIFKEQNQIVELKELFGKQLTIVGTANYKVNGDISYIICEEYAEAAEHDAIFRVLPKAISIEQQVLFQSDKKSKKVKISDLLGIWDDDISDNQLNELLKNED
jgi:hypothetical protein